MDPTLAGLIGAGIGAIAGLLGSIYSGWNQIRSQREMWLRERHGGLIDSLRSQAADVAKNMFELQHSMEWICWGASTDPDSVNRDTISQYDEEVHQVIPKLLGSLAVTAMLRLDVYEKLNQLGDEIFAIESEIARAVRSFDESPGASIAVLRAHHPGATQLYKTLPPRLHAIAGEIADSGSYARTEATG
jgi:hypothetical protein